MSFPETVDEILDVSEDEGEEPELGRTILEMWEWALAFLPGRVGSCTASPWSCREDGRSTPDS